MTHWTPLPYVLGEMEFRGRTFAVDRRVFLTDPESSHLVDAVIDALRTSGIAAPVCVDVGTGCGSLAISVMKEVPAARMIGIDVDSAALAVAAENARRHSVTIELLESEMFASWGDRPEPDVIFGDLPWGDDTSVFDESRPIEYYRAMPERAVFPPGSPTSMLARALADVRARGWRSELLLNCGCLPIDQVRQLAATARESAILRPASNVSVLRCRL